MRSIGMLAPGGKITCQYAGLADDPGLYSILFKAVPVGSKDEENFLLRFKKADCCEIRGTKHYS